MNRDDLWFYLADGCLLASLWVSSSLYRGEQAQLRTADSLHILARAASTLVCAALVGLKAFKFF